MSQTKEARPALQVGLRVKLVKGMTKDPRTGERYDYELWLAGQIPVGSVGTIYKTEPTLSGYKSLAIRWDNYVPKEGYYFGLCGQEGEPLYDQYEALPQEEPNDKTSL